MPQIPSGAGSIVPPISPCPSVMMSMKALRSDVSAIARRISSLSKGGLSRLTIRVRLTLVGATSQIACGACSLICFSSGMDPGSLVLDDDPVDAVEVGTARLPVVRVADDLDVLVRLEL